ncbi:lipoate--protein ligase family protein [Candidatus Peregrinibacteria bacterium CG_4_9_14_0_2_um_filter_53_11]|nr:MAG: lipoate--protein ligase family protein [Candidatus Peregrinibacteria bacterium CG_4_9_14_0_2_um_filter_53_11]
MKLRLLMTGKSSAAENMAIDEAVLESVSSKNSPPTLRLYGWEPKAISLGYFQSLEEEVDREACRVKGIDIVRRMTGGGAVFHDEEVTYSIHLPEAEEIIPTGVLESYRAVSEGVIRGVAELGAAASFVPLNDLVVIDQGLPRKISGNAQTRKKGVILQHGTLLLQVDVDTMFELLRVPSEKLKGKLISEIRERVTSLSKLLGRRVTFDEACEALKKGFSETFSDHELTLEKLTGDELKRIDELVRTKYASDTWTAQR